MFPGKQGVTEVIVSKGRSDSQKEELEKEEVVAR